MTGHYCTHNVFNASIPATEVDVLIVGAGMAGLYMAFQIMHGASHRPNVLVVDKIFRTGGRLDSDLISYDGNLVKEEEGGMRFTFEYMENLMALLIRLRLVKNIVPFPMNSNGNNRRYFRGHSFTVNDSKAHSYAKWSQLYNLLDSEKGIEPASAFEDIFQTVCKANKHRGGLPAEGARTPEFWQKFRLDYKWQGVPLSHWSLWNLMSTLGHSNDFITLLSFVVGFNGPLLSDVSAGEAFQVLLDFPASPNFKTLESGFSSLPNALVDAIGKKSISLNTEVTQLSRTGTAISAKYTFKDGDTYTCGEIKANHVIMALPRLPVEKIVVASPLFTELPKPQLHNIWNTLQTASNRALVKINLYYSKAWWGRNKNPKVNFGPSFTDLPLGSVYPFYTIDQELFAALDIAIRYSDSTTPVPPETQAKIDSIQASKYGKPAALTIYCDNSNVEFWKALQRNGPLFDSKLQKQYSAEMEAASLKIVAEATKFFKLLFNTEYVPEPVLTSSRIWSGTAEFGAPKWEQVGYAYHQWANGANDRDTIALLAKPISDANVYICGEAFSDYQGWVEGALRSANIVLKNSFDIKSVAEAFENKTGESAIDAIANMYNVQATRRIRKYIDPSFPYKPLS